MGLKRFKCFPQHLRSSCDLKHNSKKMFYFLEAGFGDSDASSKQAAAVIRRTVPGVLPGRLPDTRAFWSSPVRSWIKVSPRHCATQPSKLSSEHLFFFFFLKGGWGGCFDVGHVVEIQQRRPEVSALARRGRLRWGLFAAAEW